MAEPLRKNPEVLNPPDQTPSRQFKVYRYGDPNRGPRRWWFWILVAGVVIWFVIWGRGTKSSQSVVTPASTPPPAAAPASQPAVDIATLLSNGGQYLGKQVHLRDALVQGVQGSQSIFVGPSSSQQLLVLLKKGAVPETLQGKPNPIPNGGVVTITGTVEKPPSPAELEHRAGITREKAEQIVQQGIVIEADRAEPQTM